MRAPVLAWLPLVACYGAVMLAGALVLLVLAPALCWGLVWLNGWAR